MVCIKSVSYTHLDLCRLIKPEHPDTVVIFLTANDQESNQIRGYEEMCIRDRAQAVCDQVGESLGVKLEEVETGYLAMHIERVANDEREIEE